MNESVESSGNERSIAALVDGYSGLRRDADALLGQLGSGMREADVKRATLSYEALLEEQGNLDADMELCLRAAGGSDKMGLRAAHDQALSSLQAVGGYLESVGAGAGARANGYSYGQPLRDGGIGAPGTQGTQGVAASPDAFHTASSGLSAGLPPGAALTGPREDIHNVPGYPDGYAGAYSGPRVPGQQLGLGAAADTGDLRADSLDARGPGMGVSTISVGSMVAAEASRYSGAVNPKALNDDMEALRKKLQKIQSAIHPRSDSPAASMRLRSSAIRGTGSGDAAVTSRLEEAHTMAQSMKRECDKLKDELRRTQAERDKLLEDYRTAQAMALAHQNTIEDMSLERERADTEIAENQATINGLQNELALVQRQLERAQAETDCEKQERAREHDELDVKLRELTALNTTLDHEARSREKECMALRADIARLREFDPINVRSQLNYLNRTVTEMGRAMESLRKENTELKAKLAAERADLLRTIDIIQWKQASGALDDDAQTAGDAREIVRLTQELASKNSEIDDLQAQLKAARDQLRAMTKASKSALPSSFFSMLRGIDEMTKSRRHGGRRHGHAHGHSHTSVFDSSPSTSEASDATESSSSDYSSSSYSSDETGGNADLPPFSSLPPTADGNVDIRTSIANAKKYLGRKSGGSSRPQAHRSSRRRSSGSAGGSGPSGPSASSGAAVSATMGSTTGSAANATSSSSAAAAFGRTSGGGFGANTAPAGGLFGRNTGNADEGSLVSIVNGTRASLGRE